MLEAREMRDTAFAFHWQQRSRLDCDVEPLETKEVLPLPEQDRKRKAWS
jgi:hypothetical protein